MSQAEHGGNVRQVARESGRPESEWLDFSANINPFAPEVPESLWLAWRNSLTHYPEPAAESVRARLAETYGLPEEWILPTAGAGEALYLATRLFAGKNVAIVQPGFSDYSRACHAAGIQATSVVLSPDEWFAPLSEWADRLRGSDVVILGNPNNPTGSYQPIQEWRRVLEQDSSDSRVWVVDEAFIELGAGMESLTSLLEAFPNLMVVRSLTKSWGIPGLRLGFIASARNEWLQTIGGLQSPWCVSSVTEQWVETMLTRESCLANRAVLEKDLPRARDRFRAALKAIDGIQPYPSWTNFFLVELTEPSLDAARLCLSLRQEGILVRLCDSFNGIPKGRFLRFAVKSERQNRVLVSVLRRLFDSPTRDREAKTLTAVGYPNMEEVE